MKNFIYSNQTKRPTVLWILLLVWLVACTAMSWFAYGRTLSALSFIFYQPLTLPILHLILYVSPLSAYDVVQIVCMYLIEANLISACIWDHKPDWIFISLFAFYFVVLGIFFGLEIKRFKRS
ncbi:MAG: hypothetical protein J6B71_05130 [Clostridia bacterium]|nr:hypothetical protein [Clostridia bacterium]